MNVLRSVLVSVTVAAIVFLVALPFMAVERWAGFGAVAVLAFLTSIIGYVVWYWALAKGGISRVASVQFTQPLFGLALAAIVLGERPAPVTAAAGVAILTGAWIVQRAVSREPATA